MAYGRREFLQMAGLAIVAIGLKPALGNLSKVSPVEAPTGEKVLAGKRWAMVVDTRACKDGCTDCIDACRSAHNVPVIPNPNHEVKWIWQAPFEQVFPESENQFVEASWKALPTMLLCNHCDNPPCAKVCPTGATWRRDDGIVMMDFHRCIGCRYCMAACPYGSRSFNWEDPVPYIHKVNYDFPTRTKGVVEKCNFCAERLDAGLVPACVEACKEKALIFGNLKDPASDVQKALRLNFTIRRRPELGTQPNIFYTV